VSDTEPQVSVNLKAFLALWATFSEILAMWEKTAGLRALTPSREPLREHGRDFAAAVVGGEVGLWRSRHRSLRRFGPVSQNLARDGKAVPTRVPMPLGCAMSDRRCGDASMLFGDVVVRAQFS